MVVHHLIEFFVSSAFFWCEFFFVFEFSVQSDEFFDARGDVSGIFFEFFVAGDFGVLFDVAGIGEVELLEHVDGVIGEEVVVLWEIESAGDFFRHPLEWQPQE